MAKVRIVTDSAADIPDALITQHDIHILPAFVNFGDESFADDGQTLTRAQFYERLAKAETLPTTSAPPPALGEKVFREALADADHVVAIAVAGNMSSVHEGMVLAAQNVAPDRITIIDSRMLSMGHGWMAIAAAEAAAAGESVPNIVAFVEDVKSRTRIYAVLDTLEYVRRGGRVSWIRERIGTMLNIKPIFMVEDGVVSSASRVRTFEKGMKEMPRHIEAFGKLERLAVLHSNTPPRGQQLYDLVQPLAPVEYTVTVDVTTVIGTHVGPNAVGLAMVRAS